MKPKWVLNFWIYLMLCLPNSGATFKQNKQDDFFPLEQGEEIEFSRSKRMISMATGLMIANLIMSAVSIGVCTAHSVESAIDASSGCYYISDACEVEKEIKSANQEVLKILRELESLDMKVDQLKENYDASTIYFKSWTETLDFIFTVTKEVEKIGEKKMNYWGINSDAMQKLDKAKASYEEGLKDLLSSYQMDITITNSVFSGVSLFSTTMSIGFAKWSSVMSKQAQLFKGAGKGWEDLKQMHEAASRITGRVSVAFGAVTMAISAAATGICAYGIIKSKEDAQKKYNDMKKYRNDINDAVKTLQSATNDYEELIRKYEEGIQQLTSKSNTVLDIWAYHCPNYDEQTATEEEKKTCSEFLDQMKICVTCQSTLREDLNLLNTNWNYVERDAANLINVIRRRNGDMKKVVDYVKAFVNAKMTANAVYKYMTAINPEPELKSVILDAMLDNEALTAEMGLWNKWQNSGKCFNECKQQHQTRTCQTEKCIGYDKRTIPCIGGELEKCEPKPKGCPKGWDLRYGTCYKLVDMPSIVLSDLLSPEVKTLTENEQTLAKRDKLDEMCCRDAFQSGAISQKDCKNLNENNPQLARIDFQTEYNKIIVNSGHMAEHVNTQLVYLDLRVSIDTENEAIRCTTFLRNSKNTEDECWSTKSSAVCEINLSNENNVLYRLMPKRCKTKEKKIELDDVCQAEADLAETRRIYMLHDNLCTQNSWNQEEINAKSLFLGPRSVWTNNEDGTVKYITNRSYWSLNLVSDCVVQTERSSNCKRSLGKVTKVESGKDMIMAMAEVGGKLYQRTKVSRSLPQGKHWLECTFCGYNYKDFSVSQRDHLWAIDTINNVRYLSFKKMRKVDNKKMKMVSVGASGVWAVDMEGKIFSRKGTYGDLDAEGSEWEEVDSVIQTNAVLTSITSGEDIVFITFTNGQLFYRASVSQRMPKGEAWVLANHQSKEAGDILIKSFSMYKCEMIATDQIGRVFSNKKTCDCP